MSARQAFIPRPPSRITSSEPHQHPMDARSGNGDKDASTHENGKARAITAFLGQKRGANDATSQGAGPTQRPGRARAHTNTKKRSFEGIIRPETAPISLIPYPAATRLGAGTKQPEVGQTPRKTAGAGPFEFPTPASVTRGPKKGLGIFGENREKETASSGIVGPESNEGVHIGVRTAIGGYMRAFGESGNLGSAGGLHGGLEREVAAPVPGYALGEADANMDDEGREIGNIFGRSSRLLGALIGEEVGPETDKNPQRSLAGTKRKMRLEDMEESGRYSDDGHYSQGSAKRMKQVPRDPDEYFPISSPHISPTPGPLPTSRPQTASVSMLDPSLVAGSLLEDMEEFISLEQIERDWKRWRECTTEEWVNGADEFAEKYAAILNMIKDHLREKVSAFASMVSSVEERRAEVSRNIDTVHGKWNVVRENISKLGMKK